MGKRVSLRRLARSFFRWFNALLLPLALAAAAYFLARQDIRTYLSSLHLRWTMLVLSFLIASGGLLLAVWVWQQMLNALGGSKHTFGVHVRMYCYSALGDLLPGGIWKIVSRSTLYQQTQGGGLLTTATASVSETLIIGAASMTLYALGSLLSPDTRLLKSPVLAAGITCLSITLIHPRVLGWLTKWIQQRWQHITLPVRITYSVPQLLQWLILEMTVVGIGGIALFALLSSVTDAPVSLVIPMLISWAAASAAGNLFFWMPGSPILRDGALVLILTRHIAPPIALGFVVLVRLWSLGSLLLLAGIAWISAKVEDNQRP